MCYSIHIVHFSCHWQPGKLHIGSFGEDFHDCHCAPCTLVFQLFSKETPQKGCFLVIPLMAGTAEVQEQSTMLHGSLISPCFPLLLCHLQFPAPWCPEIRAMVNQRGCVLSVFWLGVSNGIDFGEAENLSCRWHFTSKPSTHHYLLVVGRKGKMMV